MRRARVTYEGAFHHAMNRSHGGRSLFLSDQDRSTFINIMASAQKTAKIRLLAYCIMSNHYHLIIQDLTNRMATFFKHLNGEYARYFRKKHGGRGYVFQDRYKSLLIQDDAYLLLSIAYTLNNPVKINRCACYLDYPWSSGQLYFSASAEEWLDVHYVENLFDDYESMKHFVDRQKDLDQLPVTKTPMGLVVGGEEFVPQALAKADRRSSGPSLERNRADDQYFEPVEKVIYEFEKKNRIKISEIRCCTHKEKRLRAQLLVLLKDLAGLRYRDIAKIDLFSDLSCGSLGMIYHRVKCQK